MNYKNEKVAFAIRTPRPRHATTRPLNLLKLHSFTHIATPTFTFMLILIPLFSRILLFYTSHFTWMLCDHVT
jgi:hypothetical protein